MYRTVLLSLHVTGVAAWLGANFVQLLVSPRLARGPAAVAAAWTREGMWLGQRYYGPAGGLIGVTGILLVLDGDWSWSAGFVMLGIATVIVGGVLGVAAFTPLAERRATALETGDEPTAAAALSRTAALGLFDSALLLLTILAMVHKWQA